MLLTALPHACHILWIDPSLPHPRSAMRVAECWPPSCPTPHPPRREMAFAVLATALQVAAAIAMQAH